MYLHTINGMLPLIKYAICCECIFQELIPEIKVTVDENSERHSMTQTYIHKLNLGVNLAYYMRHALTGFAQT